MLQTQLLSYLVSFHDLRRCRIPTDANERLIPGITETHRISPYVRAFRNWILMITICNLDICCKTEYLYWSFVNRRCFIKNPYQCLLQLLGIRTQLGSIALILISSLYHWACICSFEIRNEIGSHSAKVGPIPVRLTSFTHVLSWSYIEPRWKFAGHNF